MGSHGRGGEGHRELFVCSEPSQAQQGKRTDASVESMRWTLPEMDGLILPPLGRPGRLPRGDGGGVGWLGTGEGTAPETVSLGRGMAQPGVEGWHTVHTHPPAADRGVHAPTVFTLAYSDGGRRLPSAFHVCIPSLIGHGACAALYDVHRLSGV